MLPGLRFLLLATTMSVSVLVFALGAAALLRATHENFATLPQRRAPPEQVFVKQHFDTSQPVIALLRAEPEPNKPDGTAPAFASPPLDALPAATESKTETQPVRDVQTAAAAPESQPSSPLAVGLPDIPELPMPLLPDVSSLQSEFLRSVEKKRVEIAAAPAIETKLVATPVQQPAAIPDATKSEIAPAQKLAALSDGGAETEKLAADAKKKAEASAVRIRNQQAAKRARAARIAAQRRAAAIRARAAQQKQQTQQPFGSPFGTN